MAEMAHPPLGTRQSPGGPPKGPERSPEYLAETCGPQLLAIEVSLWTLTTTVIFLRFYVRIFKLKMFGWDDWMMVVTGAISTVCMGLWIKIVDLGMGKHAEAFPFENFPSYFRITYFYSILITASYTFVKLSIAFFILRLADRTRWRPFLIGMIVFMIMFLIGSILPIIFQCIPVQAGWDFTMRPPGGTAKCYDGVIFKNIGVFNSSVNIATDLFFALVPIPMVWKLQANLRTRVGLALILGLGLFASAVAIYKTPLQYNFFKESDWSGHGSWYYIWQLVELHVGIMAACLPTLKPLFASFFGQIRTLTKGRSMRSNSHGITFNSRGYVKHGDRANQNAFALKNLSSQSSANARDPYHEDVIMGRDSYIVTTTGGRMKRQSKSGESDESILGMEHRRSELPVGMGIIRTTEVNVTR